ncbi:hypothetical protein DSI34_12335, partial [Mycobacterium tuberculosis]
AIRNPRIIAAAPCRIARISVHPTLGSLDSGGLFRNVSLQGILQSLRHLLRCCVASCLRVDFCASTSSRLGTLGGFAGRLVLAPSSVVTQPLLSCVVAEQVQSTGNQIGDKLRAALVENNLRD